MVFVFVEAAAVLFGQQKARQVKEHKVQVILSYDNEPVIMKKGTYYIGHTKHWIFFYNENQPDGYTFYPLGTVSSVRFKYK